MNCAICGRPNPEGYRFCAGCGVPSVPTNQQPPTPTSSLTPPTPPTYSNRQPNAGARSTQFNWNKVMRYQAAIVVGSFLAIVGLFLPWVSSFGLSFSGLSIHGFLWFSFLFLVAVMVLSVLEMFIQGFSDSWPLHPLVSGMAIFSALLVLIGLLDSPSGFGWSIGPFWCLIFSLALVAVSLAPFVPGLHFLRIPLTRSSALLGTVSGSDRTPLPDSPRSPRRFCPSCGKVIEFDSQFCSSCGSRTT